MRNKPPFKILLVALHYGKEGSGGSRRSFLWAKGLRAAGHSVSVVSPYVEPNHADDVLIPHPIRLSSPTTMPPPAQRGFVEKYIKAPIRTWVRWPDAEFTWHKIVLDTFLNTNENYDWVITTSPPESAHRIGYKLAQNLDAKWCVEFRDSWVENSHRPYVRGLRKIIEGWLAKHWLKRADAITAVDNETLREAMSLSPHCLSSEIGHFSEPFSGTPELLNAETFNLVHAGGFGQSDRRRSLSSLLDKLDPILEMRADFHLHLFGPLSSAEIESLELYEGRVTYHGWVSLEKSRAIQAGSDAVLLYTPHSGSTALPGKYSEYCCLRKPIFFLGSNQIKAKAHRNVEFFTLAELVNFPKNVEMAEETENTVSSATKKLVSLLTSAFYDE